MYWILLEFSDIEHQRLFHDNYIMALGIFLQKIIVIEWQQI